MRQEKEAEERRSSREVGGGGRVRETGHMGRKGGEKRKGTLGMARRARYMVMMAKVVSNYCALS